MSVVTDCLEMRIRPVGTFYPVVEMISLDVFYEVLVGSKLSDAPLRISCCLVRKPSSRSKGTV